MKRESKFLHLWVAYNGRRCYSIIKLDANRLAYYPKWRWHSTWHRWVSEVSFWSYCCCCEAELMLTWERQVTTFLLHYHLLRIYLHDWRHQDSDAFFNKDMVQKYSFKLYYYYVRNANASLKTLLEFCPIIYKGEILQFGKHIGNAVSVGLKKRFYIEKICKWLIMVLAGD